MSPARYLMIAATAFALSAPAVTAANAHHIKAKPTASSSYEYKSVNTRRIDRRLTRQENRIFIGRENGSLTRWEARRLWFKLANIRWTKWRAARDGRINREERADLRYMLNDNNRQIRRLTNNRRHKRSFRDRVRSLTNF